MPQISYNKTGGIVVFDAADWLAGINKQPLENISSIGDGNSYVVNINPFKTRGILSPGPAITDATNGSVITTRLLQSVSKADSNYGISVGGKIHKFDNNNAVTNAGAFPHTISAHGGHATVVGHDIVTYKIGSTQYAFYSWSDNTDGDIGRFDLNATFDDDWMSTVPAVGAAVLDTKSVHPLIVGDDDILYVGDGPNVHGYENVSDTFSKNIFKLPSEYTITCFSKIDPGYLVVFAYKDTGSNTGFNNTESTAFFFDYNTSDPVKIVPLNDYYVDGAFSWNGTIGCFTQGNRDLMTGQQAVKLRLYNGSSFEQVASFTGTIPVSGGVQSYDSHILFNSGGSIYSYGTIYPDLGITFHKIASKYSESGLLNQTDSNTLYLSSAGSPGLAKISPTTFSNEVASTLSTKQVDIQTPHGHTAKVKDITIKYYSTSDTNSKTLRNYIVCDSTASLFDTVKDTTNNQIKRHFYLSSGATLPSFNQTLGLEFNWDASGDGITAPRIKSASIEFEYIKTL